MSEAQHAAGEAPSAPPPRLRTIALDVGSVRIGVALSCPFGESAEIAQPLTTVARNRAPFAEIAALCAEYGVETVVVGRPLRLNGEAGPAVAAVEGFVQQLEAVLKFQVQWVDERLSTAMAERSLRAMATKGRTRRQKVDQVAATLILQTFLDARAASAS